MLAKTKLLLIAVVFLSATTLSLQLNKEKHQGLAGSLDDFRQAELDKHNEYREMHHVDPLQLDDELNSNAQDWAEQLAASGTMQHSGRRYGQIGENLWYAWSSDNADYEFGTATTDWYNEVQNYNYRTGRSSNGQVVGHFTQVVWKGTQRVGFGIATADDGSDFVVAQYDPPGNWNRNQKNNVFSP